MRETFQDNLWPFKETKTSQKLQEVIQSKLEKCLKFILKTRKENVHLATQANHHFVASRSLTPVHSKVTKHSKLYTIFHKLNCKSKFIIYLMECTLRKVLYVEKAETAITTIGNHRKNVGKTKQP